MVMDEEKITYEMAYARLEKLVKSMESGDLTLDDSIKAYEEGLKLLKICESELNRYEKLLDTDK